MGPERDSIRFLVPWRSDGGIRQRLWTHCQAHWARECPEIPVITSDSPGSVFSRAAALNRAGIGDWDVAVVLDADVVANGRQVRQAISTAKRTGKLTLGFTTYAGLASRATEMVLQGGEPEQGGVRFRSNVHESSIVAVPRPLWDELAGFDERFVGWGQDDVAFCHAARLIGGGVERIDGVVWHLFHPRSTERRANLDTYRAAQALGKRYRACETAEQMQALLAEDRRPPEVLAPDPMRQHAFVRIYKRNGWNGTETRSGPGSTWEATERLRVWLPEVCEELGIGSMLDAGCGEGMWQPELPGYIGADIVPDALAIAAKHHPDRTYILADICRENLPTTDAVLCRDALQHLSLADGQAAIANFRRSGAKYLIASTHEGERNHDIPTGRWYPSNLQDVPFSFGEPIRTLFDGRWAGQDRYPTKSIGIWVL